MTALSQWFYKRTEKGKQTERKYNKSLAKKLANKRWNDKNKYKKKAHHAIEKALKLGIIFRQNCEICGNEKSESHHDDYTKPLDIRWLCHKHHMSFHRIYKFDN